MRRLVATTVVVTALAASPADAGPIKRTFTSKNVRTPSHLVTCSAVKHGRGIECMAPYLPDIGELDTYLALRPHGRSKLAERGDANAFAAPFHTLNLGDTWLRPGITCGFHLSGLTCRNRDHHGFTLGTADFDRF